jgi:hypothetical protein
VILEIYGSSLYIQPANGMAAGQIWLNRAEAKYLLAHLAEWIPKIPRQSNRKAQ